MTRAMTYWRKASIGGSRTRYLAGSRRWRQSPLAEGPSMRVLSKLSVIVATSGVTLAGLAVFGGREARSATADPNQILLWNRCCAVQTSTTLPGKGFGDIKFTQTGAAVTGTFT